MDQNAKSAYMMANLLGSSNDVFRCIEYRHRDAKDDSSRFYAERFLKPGQEYETKAEQIQRDQIKLWKDDYYKAIKQYSSIYDASVRDIRQSTSASNIDAIVKRFDEVTQQMGRIITQILPSMNKIHIEVLRIMENLVYNVQQFSRSRVQKTSEEIRNCFPKLNILSKLLDKSIL